MALKPCRECNREVSTSAEVCPHCGVKNPVGMSKGAKAGVGCLGLLFLFFVIGMLAGGDDTPSTPPAPRTAPAAQSTARTVDQATNVRGGPGTEHNVVRLIQPGDLVWAHPGTVDGWTALGSHRTAKDTVGYVLARLLRQPGPSSQPPRQRTPPAPTTTATTIDLKANIRFDGRQFVISNLDTFDWTNCTLEVNAGVIRSGYTLEVGRLARQNIYTVGAMQFTGRGGERFNPFTHKPERFNIRCDTPRGRGFYYGGW